MNRCVFIHRVALSCALFLQFVITIQAQREVKAVVSHKQLYQSAFTEIRSMLEGTQPTSFKRAVFLMENAFLQSRLLFDTFNSQISAIAQKLQALIHRRHLEQYKTAGNWAAFTYMVDSIPENAFAPFRYDFDRFIPSKDPEVSFVSKLLATGKGNCVSLPELYKILVEEIGVSASLALAPYHCYIKHRDEQGRWVNLEMTSGSFARDEWIMQQTGVTAEQIKSGIYMSALTEKESLAWILKELAVNYQFQLGEDLFDLEVIDTALKYYPNGIGLHLAKFEHYCHSLLTARAKHDAVWADLCNRELYRIDQTLIELAYKESSQQNYEAWVKENEKQRTANAKHSSSTTNN